MRCSLPICSASLPLQFSTLSERRTTSALILNFFLRLTLSVDSASDCKRCHSTSLGVSSFKCHLGFTIHLFKISWVSGDAPHEQGPVALQPLPGCTVTSPQGTADVELEQITGLVVGLRERPVDVF